MKRIKSDDSVELLIAMTEIAAALLDLSYDLIGNDTGYVDINERKITSKSLYAGDSIRLYIASDGGHKAFRYKNLSISFFEPVEYEFADIAVFGELQRYYDELYSIYRDVFKNMKKEVYAEQLRVAKENTKNAERNARLARKRMNEIKSKAKGQ